MLLDDDLRKYEKREPLIDDATGELTEAGKKYLDERYSVWVGEDLEKALRKCEELDPIAQKYVREKYSL